MDDTITIGQKVYKREPTPSFVIAGQDTQSHAYATLEEERIAATKDWDLVRFQVEYRSLWLMQHMALANIESLQRHEADIKQVVTWLHANAPERFDSSGTRSIGDITLGILQEWIKLRGELHDERERTRQWASRSTLGRLWYLLAGK